MAQAWCGGEVTALPEVAAASRGGERWCCWTRSSNCRNSTAARQCGNRCSRVKCRLRTCFLCLHICWMTASPSRVQEDYKQGSRQPGLQASLIGSQRARHRQRHSVGGDRGVGGRAVAPGTHSPVRTEGVLKFLRCPLLEII